MRTIQCQLTESQMDRNTGTRLIARMWAIHMSQKADFQPKINEKEESMNPDEFVQLVAEMRRVQRQFFKGDKSARLVEYAKRLEKQVDNAIDALTHPGLFDEGEND